MKTNITPEEYAQRVIDAHAKGIICAGEVWDQMVSYATATTLDVFMARLTPELHLYLQHVVLGHPDAYPHRVVLGYPDGRTEKERMLVELLREWYERPVA